LLLLLLALIIDGDYVRRLRRGRSVALA